jgi:hypothetical protein
MTRLLPLAVALGGCVGTAEPPAGTAYVEVYSGGGWSGYTQTRVYADDRLGTASAPPGGKPQSRTVVQGAPGTYARVADLVARRGPAVLASRTETGEICMDYGRDAVTAVPPVGGFASVSVSCPDEAVSALMAAVLAELPRR